MQATETTNLQQFRERDFTSSMTHGYYRSTLFSINQGNNALVKATTPLLSLLPLIKETQDLNQLYQLLVHEIKVLETNLQQNQFRHETIMAARYAICTTLDDAIAHDTDGKLQKWQSYSLLHNFHQESLEKNRFFTILQRLQQNSELHIELLELFYLCLTLGFQSMERQQYKMVTDELYQCIRKVRHKAETVKLRTAVRFKHNNYFLTWLTAGFCGGILLLAVFAFVYIFSMNLKPVYHTLKDIDKQLVKGEEEY